MKIPLSTAVCPIFCSLFILLIAYATLDVFALQFQIIPMGIILNGKEITNNFIMPEFTGPVI